MGNITKITDNIFGNHEFTYNYRGFLVKADNETYSYDSDGNMTKKGSITLTYDSVIKDRLTSFNGTTIEYDSANPLNPKRYGSNSYTFEGRRLTRLTYSGGYYEYSYNDQGQRIQKKDYRAVKWDYTYDGNRLIRETSMNGKLDFLYDEYGSLYGFIKDDDEKFFYIRDRLQNILGIVNISGQIVVKYKYDAWGKPLSVEGSLASTIGQLNPFRYKGYYFDNESGMYYCQSRYYVPEWCRWLNADSIGCLEIDRLDGLNLFAYCGNDPIMFSDGSGHFPVLACILGISALIGMGLTIGGVASDNSVMSAIGLTMVAVPALISGGIAIAVGIGGATLTGIVGGVTVTAGIGSGLFASAEYQEAFGYGNWIQDSTGMSDELYNTLMLSTAVVATLGTFASSVGSAFNIKSISQIGKFGDYYGMKFNNAAGKTRVLSFHTHGHKIARGFRSISEWHWQLQKWDSTFNKTARTIARWVWWNLMR